MHLSGRYFAALAAGAVNGLLGTGGGMILVPLLSADRQLQPGQVFPCSVAIILPICLVSLGVQALYHPLPWAAALPYLAGAVPGGILAGLWGQKIPTKLLHRLLGALILWGGLRLLWN